MSDVIIVKTVKRSGAKKGSKPNKKRQKPAQKRYTSEQRWETNKINRVTKRVMNIVLVFCSHQSTNKKWRNPELREVVRNNIRRFVKTTKDKNIAFSKNKIQEFAEGLL